jgi:hypothetical protein
MSRRSEVRTLLAGCAALLERMVGEHVLRFSSVTTIFGTPVDITCLVALPMQRPVLRNSSWVMPSQIVFLAAVLAAGFGSGWGQRGSATTARARET